MILNKGTIDIGAHQFQVSSRTLYIISVRLRRQGSLLSRLFVFQKDKDQNDIGFNAQGNAKRALLRELRLNLKHANMRKDLQKKAFIKVWITTMAFESLH